MTESCRRQHLATETAQIAGEIHYQSLQMDRGAALNRGCP